MPKLIIFDWDGTLENSLGGIYASYRQAVQDLSLQPVDYPTLSAKIGLALPVVFNALHPQHQAYCQTFVDAYRRYYQKHNQSSQLYPGVEATLNQLHQQGYLLAVATSKGRQGLDMVLSHSPIADLFTITKTASETQSKPHPQMLHEILEATETPPQDALMIGDSIYDIELGKNAGVTPIAVLTGVAQRDDFTPYACDILEDVNGLPAWLNTRMS